MKVCVTYDVFKMRAWSGMIIIIHRLHPFDLPFSSILLVISGSEFRHRSKFMKSDLWGGFKLDRWQGTKPAYESKMAEELESKIPLLAEKQNQASPSETTQKRTSLLERVTTTIFQNLLPISLVVFVILGILVPQPGVFFSKLPTNYVCVIGIFLHSGLKLKTEEVKDALKSFKAMIWGVVCILFITPVIGGHLTALLPYTETSDQSGKNSTNSSLSNEEHAEGSSILGPALFQVGMQIYFIAPCSISSGIMLVSRFRIH